MKDWNEYVSFVINHKLVNIDTLLNKHCNLKDIKSVKDFQKIYFKVVSLCEYCVTSSSKFEKWCVGKFNLIQDDFKFEI